MTLTAELKAIQDWDSRGFQIGTPTEMSAVFIREVRESELIRAIREIVPRN